MNKLLKEIETLFKEAKLDEAQAEAKLLVTEISGKTIEEIITGAFLSEEVAAKIRQMAIKRIETHAPIQHIIGHADFMGDKFIVNKDVLIPRPETELLVRASIKEIEEIYEEKGGNSSDFCGVLNTGNLVNVLDIGTGTGCIALEIAKNLPEISLEVMGVDVSTAALQVALENMNLYKLERRVVFRKSDVFCGLRPIDKFDVIVSNPPYIPIFEKENLQDEVKNFDPSLALFAPDKEGVEFYKKILEGAKAHLKNNSRVLFEIGINQAPCILQIAEQEGFKIKYILKDLSGIERVMCFKNED